MELTKEKSAFFVMLILSEGNFFNICFISMYIVYWINFQNIYTFTYQKILDAFSVSLRIHITFRVAPAKIKIPLSLFIGFAWKAKCFAFSGFFIFFFFPASFREYRGIRGQIIFTGHQTVNAIPLFVAIKEIFLVYSFSG